MSSPHDALFKAVFGQPEHARGALRAAVPAAVADALDWPSLTRIAGSFVDPALAERHTDLLFSARWHAGSDALVYLIFEHQSSSDERMAFRLLRYMVRIWERWLEDHPRAELLPVIVPVVLFHGGGPWAAPRAFDALLDTPEPLRDALAPHLVRFSYLLDDLSAIPDDQLRARAMTGLARLVEACFKHARTEPDLIERLASWAELLREVFSAPNGLEALELVMRYILVVNDRVEPEALHALLERVVSPEAKDIIMTAGERLILQGEERGLRKGLEQGMRAALLRQLRQRFGAEVTPEVEQRLASATTDRLEGWLDRVMTAATLEALLAD
jgi:predicted transposase/invertase (TIGR01784 family)